MNVCSIVHYSSVSMFMLLYCCVGISTLPCFYILVLSLHCHVVITLSCCYIVILLYCCSFAILSCCYIVMVLYLHCYHVVILLLCCYIVVLLLYCCVVILLCCYIVMVLFTLLWCCCIVVLLYCHVGMYIAYLPRFFSWHIHTWSTMIFFGEHQLHQHWWHIFIYIWIGMLPEWHSNSTLYTDMPGNFGEGELLASPLSLSSKLDWVR